jgi:hypothetical protein
METDRRTTAGSSRSFREGDSTACVFGPQQLQCHYLIHPSQGVSANLKEMRMPSKKRQTDRPATRDRRSPVQSPQQDTLSKGVTPETALRRVRQAPHPPSPAELLQLQRAVGNRAVGRLVGDLTRAPEEAEEEPADDVVVARVPVETTTTAPEGTVQRKSSAGLAGSKLTKGFAGAAYSYWTDKANKEKPLKALTDHLMKEVNKLAPLPCYWIYPAGMAATTRGSFDRTDWTIRLNTAAFSRRAGVTKVGQLNKDEVAAIVNTIYHEARHSEQYWYIARLQAGAGKNPLDIMTDMDIPLPIAMAAYVLPLKGDTKANRKLAAEAREWEQITVGKYGAYKGHVYGVLKDARAIIAALKTGSKAAKLTAVGPKVTAANNRIVTFFNPQEATILAIPKANRDKFDKNVLKRVKKIQKAVKKVKDEYDRQKGVPAKYAPQKIKKKASELGNAGYQAYRAFEHEKDTWAVGGAAARQFKRMK